MRNGPHTLKNKLIDPKRAKSRPISKKVFVGGIDANTSESEIRRHFNKFGKIEGIELPYDRQRGKRREFCFIIFENEEAADVAVKESKQTIDGRECDVKKAQVSVFFVWCSNLKCNFILILFQLFSAPTSCSATEANATNASPSGRKLR